MIPGSWQDILKLSAKIGRFFGEKAQFLHTKGWSRYWNYPPPDPGMQSSPLGWNETCFGIPINLEFHWFICHHQICTLVVRWWVHNLSLGWAHSSYSCSKSESRKMEKCYCVGDVDPAKKEVPTKGVVFFAFVKVAAKKKDIPTFCWSCSSFWSWKVWRKFNVASPQKKSYLLRIDQNNNPFFLFCFSTANSFWTKKGASTLFGSFWWFNTYL